jgi:hypothetical protein
MRKASRRGSAPTAGRDRRPIARLAMRGTKASESWRCRQVISHYKELCKGNGYGGTALRLLARVTAMATDDELLRTLREARQGILWKIVENLNSGPVDVDKLRGLAAAYNLLSQGARPFES